MQCPHCEYSAGHQRGLSLHITRWCKGPILSQKPRMTEPMAGGEDRNNACNETQENAEENADTDMEPDCPSPYYFNKNTSDDGNSTVCHQDDHGSAYDYTANNSSTSPSAASQLTYNSRLVQQRQRFLQSGGDMLSNGATLSCELALLSLLSKHGLPLQYYVDLMKWHTDYLVCSSCGQQQISSQVSYKSREVVSRC